MLAGQGSGQDEIVLGLNVYHGDASAAVVCDGQLLAAIEEERFRRIKHCAGVPRAAVRACLELANVRAEDVEHVAISRAPRAYLLQKTLFALRHPMRPRHLMSRVRNLLRIGSAAETLENILGASDGLKRRMHWVEHHPAHLASAFYACPFEEAAVCAIDGFGDFVSTSWAVGRGSSLEVLQRVFFPHSLGVVYLALTQYLGFLKYGDEYKVMGLAAYGKPDFVHQLRRLINLLPDGRIAIDLSYFCHHTEGVNMTWEDGEPTLSSVYTTNLERLLGPARHPDDPLEPRHEAIAASLQVVFEEAVFHILNGVYKATGIPRLCLAGGCGMNSVVNGKIRERTPFRDVFIQPAAGDNGTALGAALYVTHQVLRRPRRFVMEHAYWGPAFTDDRIAAAVRGRAGELRALDCRVMQIEPEDELCRWTAARIAAGQVIGWFQGRMEWGARALGNRSILADPRRHDMREIINTKIKSRENFRPFAPSILEERLDEYFQGAVPDPFMIQVYPVRSDKRQVIPAVTHVDGSGRLQTVNRRLNPLYWRLIKAFETQTGVPVLLNTSFNENEPIVHQPEEALDCFLRTRMDVLVLGTYVLTKSTGLSGELSGN
jgi:carbamoyltransferase